MEVVRTLRTGMDLSSIRQEIEKLGSVTRRRREAVELEETKRRVEKLIEELRPCSNDEEVKPLCDALQDILMELTVKIETSTSHCKPF